MIDASAFRARLKVGQHPHPEQPLASEQFQCVLDGSGVHEGFNFHLFLGRVFAIASAVQISNQFGNSGGLPSGAGRSGAARGEKKDGVKLARKAFNVNLDHIWCCQYIRPVVVGWLQWGVL